MPPAEIYRLAGERAAELVAEVESLRAEAYGDQDNGDRDAGSPESALCEMKLGEAESRMEGCLQIMECAQQRMEAGASMEAVWTAAAETLALASKEARDLTRRRAEFSLELYAQERMSSSEAEEHLERIEARLAILARDIERAQLAISVIEAREDRALSVIGKRAGTGADRRLRLRL
jgi:hypothetical protein